MWDSRKTTDFMKKAGALGSVLGLDNMKRLMAELGNVQEELSIIHVAGTNGKGSVCAMLEQILRSAGYRTGRYSSPEVFCYEEKYQINGVYIYKEEFDAVMEKVAAACARIEANGFVHPTLFEIETAAAFLWFYEKNCQIVLLETGLGGRLDATNIIKKPLCSVITSISMDHMGFLGSTLAEIAGEKAGIIKEGCPVITAAQPAEVYQVLQQSCDRHHTDLVTADIQGVRNIHFEDGYLVFDWENLQQLQLSLIGSYQIENAVCAIKTIHRLNSMGFCITDETIHLALKNTRWPGRFEVIGKKPLVVIDGAHNEDAAKKLRETLERGFTNRKIIYIIGVLADKEHEKILSCMLPLAEQVYTITPNNPRALSGELLRQEAKKYHPRVSFSKSISQAVQDACGAAEEEPDTMVVAFGSLSYLGEVKKEIQKEKNNDR